MLIDSENNIGGDVTSNNEPSSNDEALDAWESMLAAENSANIDGKEPNTDIAGAGTSNVKSVPERVLNQQEIDSLLGFDVSKDDSKKNKGIRAMLDKALESYERLPMLEIVFDRFVRILSTSMRNFTSETVDIDIRSISSLRFGNYTDSIPMPALITVFKAIEWENFGLISTDAALIYSLVDILFGGRKILRPLKLEGRQYTSIEQDLVKQLSEIILSDLSDAFDPLSPATLLFERIETNPRFATIARSGDAAILLQLRVEMEERGGEIEILFPYATLEPIRGLLLQVLIGERFGKNSEWEEKLLTEVTHLDLELEAILMKKTAIMQDIINLKIGSTIIMDNYIDEDVILHCCNKEMFSGKIGRVGDKIGIIITEKLDKNLITKEEEH